MFELWLYILLEGSTCLQQADFGSFPESPLDTPQCLVTRGLISSTGWERSVYNAQPHTSPSKEWPFEKVCFFPRRRSTCCLPPPCVLLAQDKRTLLFSLCCSAGGHCVSFRATPQSSRSPCTKAGWESEGPASSLFAQASLVKLEAEAERESSKSP